MPADDHAAIQRWTTADVPQSRRLEYFASAISEAVIPIGIDNADPSRFQAEVSFAHLGPIGVAKVAGSAHGAFRGRSEMARSTEHSFALLMTLQAGWTVDHRGSQRMMPRDVLILDSHFPLRAEVSQSFLAINVGVSEAWLRQWLPDPNSLVAKRIPGDSLWGLALSSYLSELSPELAAAPPIPLSLMADQVGSLLALTAGSMRGGAPSISLGMRSLHERIRDTIRERCAEPQLTAADVAAAVNTSLRTLHRTLAAAGETFGVELIEARAQTARRMLTSSLFKQVTTAEIGRRSGFQSPSHFVRVMRTRTGNTPRQLRILAGARSPQELDAEDADELDSGLGDTEAVDANGSGHHLKRKV